MPSRQRDLPRPTSVSAAGYFLVALGFLGFLRALYLANFNFHDEKPEEHLPYLFLVPTIVGLCAPFLFSGSNKARILYWVLAPAAGIVSASFVSNTLTLAYAVVTVFAALLLATPNAHWYFTGRDFRRRPAYRASVDRARAEQNTSRRGGYDY